MTPEQLDEIRKRSEHGLRRAWQELGAASAVSDRAKLLDYIDLLHEDLRITRQERDHAKHQALEHRKARAQAEDERDAYRRGQGPAPTPATPGTTALHETHPIPNSRGETR